MHMKTLLICFGLLAIFSPIVIIIGNFTGKTLITDNEYFFMVAAFIVAVLLYDKKKTA